MRVLQLCHKPPMPPVDGGCIAINNITQGLLNSGHEVKLLSLATHKHPCRKEILPADYLEKTRFETVFVDTDVKGFDALASLLKGKSYHVYRFYSREMAQKLAQVLQQESFDIVQLESIFVATCATSGSSRPTRTKKSTPPTMRNCPRGCASTSRVANPRCARTSTKSLKSFIPSHDYSS